MGIVLLSLGSLGKIPLHPMLTTFRDEVCWLLAVALWQPTNRLN